MTEQIDRHEALSGTREVPAALAFDVKRLENFLVRTVPGFRGPTTVRQFRGGQSKPTYLVSTPTDRFVLRRKPPGEHPAGAHAIDREFRVLAALSMAHFPVPQPLIYSDDRSITGTDFYIMTFMDGRVFWEPSMPSCMPSERGAIYESMCETLARMHSFDPGGLGLRSIGKAGNFVARELERWTLNYRLTRSGDIPEMNRLSRWLSEHLPPDRPARLVHGDYRLDNLIIAPDEPRVIAVVDWELATLGDPLADAVYHFMSWMMPPSDIAVGAGTLLGLDLDELGIPQLERYIAMYAARMGLSEIPYLETYFAYNFFRLAAILQGIAASELKENPQDAHGAMVASQVRPLAQMGWAFALKAGAI